MYFKKKSSRRQFESALVRLNFLICLHIGFDFDGFDRHKETINVSIDKARPNPRIEQKLIKVLIHLKVFPSALAKQEIGTNKFVCFQIMPRMRIANVNTGCSF